jgi:hypothetical protein
VFKRLRRNGHQPEKGAVAAGTTVASAASWKRMLVLADDNEGVVAWLSIFSSSNAPEAGEVVLAALLHMAT